MKTQEKNNLKRWISTLMLGVYCFALFSSNMHHHENSLLFSFPAEKSESNIKNTIQQDQATDCMACHFLNSAHAVLPQNFSFALAIFSAKTHTATVLQEKIFAQNKFSFPLRGPPAVV